MHNVLWDHLTLCRGTQILFWWRSVARAGVSPRNLHILNSHCAKKVPIYRDFSKYKSIFHNFWVFAWRTLKNFWEMDSCLGKFFCKNGAHVEGFLVVFVRLSFDVVFRQGSSAKHELSAEDARNERFTLVPSDTVAPSSLLDGIVEMYYFGSQWFSGSK